MQAKPTQEQSARISSAMTDSERAKILRTKQLTAPEYEGQADEIIEIEKGNLESGQDRLVKAALVRIAEEFEAFTNYKLLM